MRVKSKEKIVHKGFIVVHQSGYIHSSQSPRLRGSTIICNKYKAMGHPFENLSKGNHTNTYGWFSNGEAWRNTPSSTSFLEKPTLAAFLLMQKLTADQPSKTYKELIKIIKEIER